MASRTRLTTAMLAVLGLGGPSCAEQDDNGSGSNCSDAKCDALDGDIREDLKELNDPIAQWLLEVVDADGVLESDYLDMLRAIGEQQGCGEETIDTYVISDELIVEGGAFPRLVNTVCSTDRTKADLAFFALSFPAQDGIDIETRQIEMFAWDRTSREYRFYKTEPVGRTQMQVHLEPAECADCHMGPEFVENTATLRMRPIMNELQQPWEHWFAQPITVSHEVSEATKRAPNYAEIAGEKFLKSASRLEQSIRTAYNQRTAPARLRERRNKPADVEQAMGLLRPLFCDEQAQYVTEDGASGILPSSAVLDNGFHSVYTQIMGQGWPWEWWNDRQLRITPAGADDPVNMLPVRGESLVTYEKQLMSSRALSPEQVLRIRALDWHVPVFSEFRCGLWHKALPRVIANPPIEGGITESTRNLHLFSALLDEILTLHADEWGVEDPELAVPLPIVASAADKVITMGRATVEDIELLAIALFLDEQPALFCEFNGAGACERSVMDFGDMIEFHFKEQERSGRAPLHEARNSRGCFVLDNFPNKPFIPGLSCPG